MEVNFNLESKLRIDQFLSNEIDFLSREKIKKLIKDGYVKVNNKVVLKSNFLLENEGIISLEIPKEENDKLVPDFETKFPEIIFENKDYLIINKPSGLIVHPGSGNQLKTLSNILIAKYKKLPNLSTNRPGIVHRLDKNTSGVMVIAKTEKFYNHISKQFENSEVEKLYELITEGKYKNMKGIIDVPMGRDDKNRKLMKATLKNSKPAKSIYEVKELFLKNSYVNFKIETGRTHQIRVHSKYIGAPVLNDLEYSKNIFDKDFGQYLHAKKISFLNLKNKKVAYEANLPKKFISKLNELRTTK